MIFVLIVVAKIYKRLTVSIQEKIVAGLSGTSVTIADAIGGKKIYESK